MKKNEMVIELNHLISEYLGEQEHRNLMTLSRNVEIGYATLRRITKFQVIPKLDTVCSILGVITNTRRCIAFLENYFPKEFTFIADSLSARQEVVDNSIIFKQVLENRTDFLILAVASGITGISREKALDYLGQNAIRRLRQLTDLQLLTERKGYYFFQDKDLWMSKDSQRRSLVHLIDLCNGELAPSTNKLFFRRLNLNKEGLEKLEKLLLTTTIKLESISNDPQFHYNSNYNYPSSPMS